MEETVNKNVASEAGGFFEFFGVEYDSDQVRVVS